jgi:hypothetical protein
MANISPIIKATSAIVKVSNKIGANNKIASSSSKISQIPKSSSSNKKVGGELIKRDSFSLFKKTVKKSGSAFESIGLGENVKQILAKVIQIDSLLKGTTALHKKFNKINIRTLENKKRAEREDKLEKIPKTDNEAKKLPSMPGMGFLEGIMRFFMNMLIGWFALKFLNHLPLLLKIIKPLGYAVDWILDFSGKLLDGLVTFVDWGFKAYEFTRGAIKKIGGEGGLKVFDKFSNALTTFINLALIAGMLSTMGGGGGPSRGRGSGGPRSRPGSGGRPRVTTSGGRPQGKPNIRNPFRERPSVTQGGKGGGFRNPFRQGPRVTTSGGNVGFRFPKLNPKSLVSGARTFGIGLALDYAVDEFVSKPIEEATIGRSVNRISSLPPQERKKRIQLLLAEIKKERDWQSGTGGAFDKAIKLGGLLGETSSEKKVKLLEETLARLQSAGYYGGGLVTVAAAGGGPISRAGKFLGGISRGLGDITRRLSFNMPSISDIIPGSKIGGEQEIEKIFPNPSGKSASPLQYLTNTGNTFSDTDYLGPMFSVVSKSILGSKITNEDYRNIGLGMNAWIASGINEKKLNGGISPAFAEGGFVQQVSTSEDISKWAEESAKKLISPKVAETNKDLLRNLLLQNKYPGKNESGSMEGELPDPNLDIDSGGFGGTVTGGNADFWSLVAIASLESGVAQGRADVAQSIYNRLSSGIYSGRTIKELIVSGNGRQYQPVGRAPEQFRSIQDKESAINAVMAANKLNRSQAEKFINDTAAAIQNKDLQASASQFVGGRTDFWAEGLRPPDNGIGYTVRNGHRFGWFVGPAAIAYGKKNPGPATAPNLGDIAVMGGGRSAGAPTGKTITWKEWGNYLQKLGFRPTENAFFGGLQYSHSTPDHARNAMDAGYWKDNNYVEATKKYERMFKPLEGSSFSQILGPISDWKGHGEGKPGNTHLHFTAKRLDSQGLIPVTPALQKIMSSYERGGIAGMFGPEIARIGEKGKEAVLDTDTTLAVEKYAPGFLLSLNQGDSKGSIKALQAYAAYESGASETVIIDTGGYDGNNYDTENQSGSYYRGGENSSNDYDPFEILERLPG